ncbi:unnamed protein product [Onchocerca flexuosa]|uniref:Ig-like domain-containing protein n=1 Tax=Onchocerca flexuosa TaxID=387005 RepID=A0A183I6M1_9BILA|nr:unnamed protein product [Onchocerca flexuosa]
MELVSPLLPSTTVAVECDVFATDINNASLHSASEMSYNPGLNYIWQDEQRRHQKRGEELTSKSSQKERTSLDTEKEKNYFCRLHTFFKGISTVSLGATQSDAFHIPKSTKEIEINAPVEHDFETKGTGIFDEELFLENEDEMNEVMGGMEDNEQEFQEDFDLGEEVGAVCGTIKSSNSTSCNLKHLKSM